MPSHTLKTGTHLKHKNVHKLLHRMKLAEVMTLPEREFAQLIYDIESNPLFKRFLSAETQSERLFGHQRFARAGLASSFLEINESTMPAGDGLNWSEFLEDKREVFELCERIGMENFQTYFLYNDGKHSLSEIAETCGIKVEEVRSAMDLVNQVALQEEFVGASTSSPELAKRHACLAQFTRETDGTIAIRFSSLKYARGRYVIDYQRLTTLKASRTLTKAESDRLTEIVRSMELVNARKTTICQILDVIAEKQGGYLTSGRWTDLKPLSQVQLSKTLRLHGSTISRAVNSRSVMAPWHEELPLHALLVKGPVNQIKAALQKILGDEEKELAAGTRLHAQRDDELGERVHQAIQERVATRTIAKYRSELKEANVYLRTQAARAGRRLKPSEVQESPSSEVDRRETPKRPERPQSL